MKYTTAIIVPLTENQIGQSKQHAYDVVHTNVNHYAKRMQCNPDRIRQQIVSGKVAEFGTYTLLNALGSSVAPPDLNIYDAAHKSYDIDLPSLSVKNAGVHVKSCESTSSLPVSWVFQCQEGHSTDNMFTQQNQRSNNIYISLCYTNIQDKFIVIYFLSRLSVLFDHALFSDPLKECLVGIKKVVYNRDIQCDDSINSRFDFMNRIGGNKLKVLSDHGIILKGYKTHENM